MKEKTKGLIKMAGVAALWASVLSGCCLFGGKKDCDEKKACANQAAENCAKDCPTPKTSGVNAAVTLGVGTGGVHAGTAGNIGQHGASASVGGEMH